MDLFYEDLHEGHTCEAEPFILYPDEIIEFARQWDPQPFHLGEVTHPEIGLGHSASGLHILSATVRQFVVADIFSGNIVLGAGFDAVRFRAPVFAMDRLHPRAVLTSRRRMGSRPHLGLLKWHITAFRDERAVFELTVVNLIRVRHQV